jgi:hypothetical protein
VIGASVLCPEGARSITGPTEVPLDPGRAVIGATPPPSA